MEQQAVIADIEARAKKKGLTMAEVCAEAGVHPTTVSRWKRSQRNPDPVGATMKSLERLDEALRRMPAARAADHVRSPVHASGVNS